MKICGIGLFFCVVYSIVVNKKAPLSEAFDKLQL